MEFLLLVLQMLNADHHSNLPGRRDEGRVIVRDFLVSLSPPAEGAPTDHHGVYEVRQHVDSPQHFLRVFQDLSVGVPVFSRIFRSSKHRRAAGRVGEGGRAERVRGVGG